MILAERYIEFHNAVNRAASYQEGVYPFHDELDILFHALKLWETWDVGASQLAGIKGWPPYVGNTIRGAMSHVYGIVFEGWQWDLTTIDYAAAEGEVARREADLKEADAKYHAAFEARNQVVHGGSERLSKAE